MNSNVIKETEDLKVKIKSEENMIKSITLTYEDGTTQVIEKGMAITLNQKENYELSLEMEMCNMSGADFLNVMYGVLQEAAQFIDID